MAIVSFWSNIKKETAQTLSIVAIATYMAVEHNSKILILDTNFNNPTINNCFFNSNMQLAQSMRSGRVDLGSGISGLTKLITSGKINPESITDYTKIIFKNNRLELLTNVNPENPMEAEKIKSGFPELVKMAGLYYDYVFVDLQKGLDEPFIKKVIDVSNVVVTNITQRMRDLDEFNILRQNDPTFRTEKIFPLIGRYDRFSKYTKKNVARHLGFRREFSAVPYNTLFFEAASEGGVRDYFMKFRKDLIDSSDRNSIFIQEIGNTAENIMMRVQENQMRR
ncbi:MAG: hypothetical protein IKF52_04400 [Clostridia bacterium]|nr:hypothetical protein [Clostridia bacterium]